MPLVFVFVTFASFYFTTTECQQEVEPPSLKIIINQSGVKKLEDVLHKKMRVFEEKLTNTDTITFPDISSSSYKITDLHLSELTLKRPGVQIVPGVGLKVCQNISSSVVEGDYEVKALFFWVNGKITMKTSLMLEVTVGVGNSVEGQLAVVSKGCSVTFRSFHLDLHNSIYSAVASLMEGTITRQIEITVCEHVNKQFEDLNIMDNIPFQDSIEKESPGVIFEADRIEFYARLTRDANLHQMPVITNQGNWEICLMLSKDLVKNSGKEKMHKMEFLKKARKFVPALSEENLDFKEMENFLRICSDLNLDDLMIESAEKFIMLKI